MFGDGRRLLGTFVQVTARIGLGLLLATAVACGEDSSRGKSRGGGGSPVDDDGNDGPQCTHTGFAGVEEEAVLDSMHQLFTYSAVTGEVAPFDVLVIESYQSSTFNGPTGPGTFSLDGTNYATCGLCVLAYSGCSDTGCEKTFYADKGTVEITSLGGDGSQFSGTLLGVELKEVTINDSWESTPVPGGGLWCTDGYTFDLTVSEKVAEPVCVAEGNGALLGSNIADFSLQNCNGEMVSLHSRCGNVKAVWMVIVAGWCTACADFLPEVAQMHSESNASGLDVMVILGEDASEHEPTLSYCSNYATSHGLDPSLVFIDWGDEWGPWETTFSNIYPYIGDTIALPWNGVLRGSNMEYVYAETFNGYENLSPSINSLLSAGE